MSGWVRRKTTVHIWDEAGRNPSFLNTFPSFSKHVPYFCVFSQRCSVFSTFFLEASLKPPRSRWRCSATSWWTTWWRWWTPCTAWRSWMNPRGTSRRARPARRSPFPAPSCWTRSTWWIRILEKNKKLGWQKKHQYIAVEYYIYLYNIW